MNEAKIKPSDVFKTIQANLVALRSIDYQQLSKVERGEMRRKLLEVRELWL